MAGDTDLALGKRKFSGNAQRRKRRFLLFHGTFLTGLDFKLLDAVLPFPSRQPRYRENRSHADFLVNIHTGHAVIISALRKIWGADEPLCV